MNNVFIHSTQFTQHSSLLIFRQFRLSLKCSQSRRLNNYTLCSIDICCGNYPISNTTPLPSFLFVIGRFLSIPKIFQLGMFLFPLVFVAFAVSIKSYPKTPGWSPLQTPWRACLLFFAVQPSIPQEPLLVNIQPPPVAFFLFFFAIWSIHRGFMLLSPTPYCFLFHLKCRGNCCNTWLPQF